MKEYIRATTFPVLIGVGEDPFKLSPLLICVEGNELVNVTLCSCSTTLQYLEYRIPRAKKLISIQKFTKELEHYMSAE